MSTTTIGIFHDRSFAERALAELRNLGLRDTDMSYVATDTEGKAERVDGAGKNVAGGAAGGATTGAIVGAIAGLAVANGILPGLGSLFVAGPIATALGLTGGAATTAAGAMTGAAAGGLVGAFTGLGVSKDDALMYENRVKSGDIVVTAQSSEPTGVRNVLSKYGAEEVREYNR